MTRKRSDDVASLPSMSRQIPRRRTSSTTGRRETGGESDNSASDDGDGCRPSSGTTPMPLPAWARIRRRARSACAHPAVPLPKLHAEIPLLPSLRSCESEVEEGPHELRESALGMPSDAMLMVAGFVGEAGRSGLNEDWQMMG